jgi:hypothetical protein
MVSCFEQRKREASVWWTPLFQLLSTDNRQKRTPQKQEGIAVLDCWSPPFGFADTPRMGTIDQQLNHGYAAVHNIK